MEGKYVYHNYKYFMNLMAERCHPSDTPAESEMGTRDLRNVLWLAGKESAYNVGALGSIPGLGRFPGEGKSYPLQYSGLENSMNCVVHGVTKSQTLSLSRMKLMLYCWKSIVTRKNKNKN